jgi:hypothetical protein
MDVDVELEFIPVDARGTADELDAFIDTVLEELDKIGWGDVDVTATLAQRRVIFSAFDVESDRESMIKFWDALRTALHAAGAATPDWNHGANPKDDHLHLWAVEKVAA